MSRVPTHQFTSSSTALSAAGTAKTVVVQPSLSNVVSRGISKTQSPSVVDTLTAAAAFTTTTLVNAAASTWGTTEYVGHVAYIYAGTGAGQSRIIASHTNTVLTFDVPLLTAPDGTSRFRILEPDSHFPIINEWVLRHTGTPGNITLESRGVVNGVLVTRPLAIYDSLAAASGILNINGMVGVGVRGGDLRVTPSGAMAGFTFGVGWWCGEAEEVE